MARRDDIDKRLHITPAIRDKHDFRRDTAFEGRYLMRLPDRTLIPADEYDARLREYRAHTATADHDASCPAHARAATLDDATALAPLLAQLGYPTTPDQMRGRLAAVLDRADYATLVAETGGQVVGLAGAQLCPSYNRDRPSGRLVTLVVDEGFRGRGIGALLVRSTERWLVVAGAGSVFVNSRRHRGEAHRFYERLGYETNGVRMVRSLDARPGVCP